jgi:glycosyltransferase involved in cell wall biosynthesis
MMHLNVIWPAAIFAFYLHYFFGLKYIITEHWSGYLSSDSAYERMNLFVKYFIRMTANRAKVITPVSIELKNAMISHGFKTNYELVYNTANISIFYPPIENKLSDKIKFLHVSTLVEKEKNVFGILNVVKQLSRKRKNFFLQIISDKGFSEYQTYAQKLEILEEFVSFSGPADASEIADAMRKSHCFVLFSNYENLPVVIIESLACGLPVISTSVGGVPDHITEDFGILIPPKDENALYSAMETMMDNWMKYDSEKMRKYAVDNFSYEAVGEKFNEIYRKNI